MIHFYVRIVPVSVESGIKGSWAIVKSLFYCVTHTSWRYALPIKAKRKRGLAWQTYIGTYHLDAKGPSHVIHSSPPTCQASWHMLPSCLVSESEALPSVKQATQYYININLLHLNWEQTKACHCSLRWEGISEAHKKATIDTLSTHSSVLHIVDKGYKYLHFIMYIVRPMIYLWQYLTYRKYANFDLHKKLQKLFSAPYAQKLRRETPAPNRDPRLSSPYHATVGHWRYAHVKL